MQRHSIALFAAILRSSGSAVGSGAMHSVRALHTLPSLASWATSQQPMLVQKLCTEAVRAQHKQAQCSVNIHRGFAAQAQVRPQIRGQQPRQRKIDPSGTQGLYLVAFTVAMIGVTYASVPLYRMFCQATGYGGTVQQGSTVEDKLKQRELVHNAELEAAAAARDLTVFFNADVSDSLPWKFTPTQRSVSIKPGESTLAFYTAQNLSDKSITGVSTYNVTPQQAGVYFNKIQCFCFEEQKLRPGEKIDMPVFFYVDPEFATDPKLRSFNQLTLSYTFFKVNEEDAEEDDDAPAEQAAA